MNYKELKSLMEHDGKYNKSFAEKVMEKLQAGYYSDTGFAAYSDQMKKALQDEIHEKYYL